MATKKSKETASKGGRPPNPNMDELKRTICDGIAKGNSLATTLQKEGMPGFSTVMAWLRADPEFQKDYAHAREARAEVMFDEIDDVSEQAVLAGTAIEVAGLRLKADNIKWKLARMNAKKYGDKQQVDMTAKVELDISQVDQKLERLLAKAK